MPPPLDTQRRHPFASPLATIEATLRRFLNWEHIDIISDESMSTVWVRVLYWDREGQLLQYVIPVREDLLGHGALEMIVQEIRAHDPIEQEVERRIRERELREISTLRQERDAALEAARQPPPVWNGGEWTQVTSAAVGVPYTFTTAPQFLARGSASTVTDVKVKTKEPEPVRVTCWQRLLGDEL